MDYTSLSVAFFSPAISLFAKYYDLHVVLIPLKSVPLMHSLYLSIVRL